jgi:hypothetical protein
MGIGLLFNGGTKGSIGGFGVGPGVTFKTPKLPITWGVNAGIDGSKWNIGVMGDWYFIDDLKQGAIKDFGKAGKLGWFLGAGAYVGLGNKGDDMYFNLGARVPVGISYRPTKLVQIFADVVPQLGIGFNPIKFPDFGIGFDLGVRLWV